MSRDEICAIYDQGKEATVSFIELLLKQIKGHEAKIAELSKRVSELESRLNQNSSNSSKPPSTNSPFEKDRRKTEKNPSVRKKRKKRKGSTLKQSENPDKRVLSRVNHCDHCGASLKESPPAAVDKRQVFDIPKIKAEVTEYQREVKDCPCCGKQSRGSFPAGVSHQAQYGGNIRALAVYLRNRHFIPLERLREVFSDVLGIDISEGTLVNMSQRAYESLKEFEAQIEEILKKSPALHCDETGIDVSGRLHWLHVASTQEFTLLSPDEKRGSEGMNNMGILNDYQGTIIHDGWSSYRNYLCTHALCNAHHLRELTGVYENTGQDWALELKELLRRMKKTTDRSTNNVPCTQTTKKYLIEYQAILDKGFRVNPPPQKIAGKRGKVKKSKALNLLERLDKHKDDALRFIHDPIIPFDNNQAERDFRMVKVRQKISGCFRNMTTARHFARIYSYISTMRKHKRNVLVGLKQVMGEKYSAQVFSL